MSRPRTLILCTRNVNKRFEVDRLLASRADRKAWTVQTLDEIGVHPIPAEEGVEAHPTFEENVLAKARHFARRIGDPRVGVVAEDSGLCVDALDGAPGVRSKRFSGASGPDVDAANNRLLLAELRGAARQPWTARYRAVAAYVGPHAAALVSSGECEGTIAGAGRGSGGFGYDPLFVPDGFSRTMAELSVEEKGAISHRGRALNGLLERLAVLDPRPGTV